MYQMLFPCLSGLSAYRNPQDLLALYALLLETTESHCTVRFLGRKLQRKSFSGKIFQEKVRLLNNDLVSCFLLNKYLHLQQTG